MSGSSPNRPRLLAVSEGARECRVQFGHHKGACSVVRRRLGHCALRFAVVVNVMLPLIGAEPPLAVETKKSAAIEAPLPLKSRKH